MYFIEWSKAELSSIILTWYRVCYTEILKNVIYITGKNHRHRSTSLNSCINNSDDGIKLKQKGNHIGHDSSLALALISIDFYDFVSPFTPYQFLFRLRRYIKHDIQCFIRLTNSSVFQVKNTPLCVVLWTLLSVLGNRMKHYLPCLISVLLQNVFLKILSVHSFSWIRWQLMITSVTSVANKGEIWTSNCYLYWTNY